MRNAFAKEITELAGKEPRLIMMMADIGNRLFNDYRDKYPDRFFNAGVAEANMISMAAGMAASGLRPICYTITPFVTARCYEQIKVDVAYHEMPVVIVGTGSGLSYASLGVTHHSLDDLALLRGLPGFVVLAPCDAMEVKASLRLAFSLNQPVYIRIGKKGEPVLHRSVPEMKPGGTFTMKEGNDVLLMGCGNIVAEAMAAAEKLETLGISTAVASAYSVKPLDKGFLQEALSKYKIVAVLEEHFAAGGYASALAEWLVTSDIDDWPGKLLPFGADDHFLHDALEQAGARKAYHMDSDSIVSRVQQRLAKNK
jgi:transketolase